MVMVYIVLILLSEFRIMPLRKLKNIRANGFGLGTVASRFQNWLFPYKIMHYTIVMGCAMSWHVERAGYLPVFTFKAGFVISEWERMTLAIIEHIPGLHGLLWLMASGS